MIHSHLQRLSNPARIRSKVFFWKDTYSTKEGVLLCVCKGYYFGKLKTRHILMIIALVVSSWWLCAVIVIVIVAVVLVLVFLVLVLLVLVVLLVLLVLVVLLVVVVVAVAAVVVVVVVVVAWLLVKGCWLFVVAAVPPPCQCHTSPCVLGLDHEFQQRPWIGPKVQLGKSMSFNSQWSFLVPLIGGRYHIFSIHHLYTTYILPIGWLYITYHLLREPETAIEIGLLNLLTLRSKKMHKYHKVGFF